MTTPSPLRLSDAQSLATLAARATSPSPLAKVWEALYASRIANSDADLVQTAVSMADGKPNAIRALLASVKGMK